jgi:hypothetical protein
MTCTSGGQPCPLRFEILGSGFEAEKLKRRVTCALAGLGWSADIPLHADPARALDLGATRDPVLLADEIVFAQGLPRTEELEALLRARIGEAAVPPTHP